LWTMPNTLMAQVVFLILIMTGWFQSWTQLLRPLPGLPLWRFFCLQLVTSFVVLPFGTRFSLYVGGLLLPLSLVVLLAHHRNGFWYPFSAAVFLTSILLFIREFIRYSPVFWIMDEAWGVSLMALALAFAVGRHIGESWLLLTVSLTAAEAGFLLLHWAQWEHLDVGGPWFQGVWWRTLWLGAVATGLWQWGIPLLKSMFGQRRSSVPFLRRAISRK